MSICLKFVLGSIFYVSPTVRRVIELASNYRLAGVDCVQSVNNFLYLYLLPFIYVL